MKRWIVSVLVVGVALGMLSAGLAWAQGLGGARVGVQGIAGSGFSYQGYLEENGVPANGTYDFRFRLFDAATGGTQVGPTVVRSDVAVEKGRFTVQLDFGDVFDGRALWLEVGVRPGTSTGAYTSLSPRQALRAAPMALTLRPGAVISDVFLPATQGGEARTLTVRQGEMYTLTLGYTKNLTGSGGLVWEGRAALRIDAGPAYAGNTIAGDFYTGIRVETRGQDATPILAFMQGTASDLMGAVEGHALATSTRVAGVYGSTNSPRGWGVWGDGPGTGVMGTSGQGFGGYFRASKAQPAAVSGHVVVIENTGPDTTDGPDGLAIVLTNVGTPSGAHNYITFFKKDGPDADTDPDAGGRIEGNGSGGVTYQTTGADFAEMLPATAGLEPGDVLVIGPDGRLTRSTAAYQANVVGVYSRAPGFLGDRSGPEGDAGEVPVALVGVVEVKASAENGPIRPGDVLVTSDTPGHVMRTDPVRVNGVPVYPSGAIVGKALEGLEAGTGTILMVVLLH